MEACKANDRSSRTVIVSTFLSRIAIKSHLGIFSRTNINQSVMSSENRSVYSTLISCHNYMQNTQ